MAIENLSELTNLGVATVQQAKPKDDSLGQAEFLKLMTTQMTHQDPMKPMQNGEFLSQLAQFGTVSGIQDLQKSFSEFAGSISSSQALQAASLVGKSVLIPSKEAVVSLNKNLKGEVNLPASANDVVVQIQKKSGETVKELNLGRQSAGNVKFEWDGLLNDGTFADPGVYRIKAFATIDGQNTGLETFVVADVNSVSMANGQRGIQLGLNGLDSTAFNQVKQIF